MASVGKGVFFPPLLLTARERVKSSARCPGLFFLCSFFFLNTSTPESEIAVKGEGGRAALLFSLLCVYAEPSGAEIIKININESSRQFFSPKLVHFKVIRVLSGSGESARKVTPADFGELL